jgi:hypothetical protein
VKAAALVLLLLLPAPAAAQYGSQVPPPPPEPRGRQAPAEPATPAAAADLQRGAACQVERGAASVETLLATAPFSAEERTEAVRVLRLIQRCLRSSVAISTSAVLLRGVIAEVLYESRFATAQAALAPPVSARPLFRAELATTRADAATLAPAYALAECTAARHGELVRGLLATEPGSAEAQSTFQALNPAFVSCVTGDTRFNVDGRTLRGILAEMLYRWSVVQRDGPTSPLAAATSATP